MRIFRDFGLARLVCGRATGRSPTRTSSLGTAVGFMIATLLLLGSQSEAYSAPKYFMKIRDTELAAGVEAQAAKNLSEAAAPASEPDKSDGAPAVAAPQASASSKPVAVGEMVRTVLIETLRKQPDVTLELESPIANTEAVKAECKRKGLRAFELAVRVLRFDRGVKPPTAGKRFRLLEQNVKLSVVGTTYPEGLLAVGGDGESTIQIEIGERVTPGQEREVLEEAVKDAVEQAVKQGMLKLSQPRGKPTNEKRKRK